MKTLKQNEAIIEKGLKSFVEVGEALKEIRDNKQYDKVYGTGIGWPSYLKQRWGMTQQFAGKLIIASETVARLKADPTVSESELPQSESQSRELNGVPEEEQAEVMKEAAKEAKTNGKPLTAKVIRKVAAKKKGKPVESKVDRLTKADKSNGDKAKLYTLSAFQEEVKTFVAIIESYSQYQKVDDLMTVAFKAFNKWAEGKRKS